MFVCFVRLCLGTHMSKAQLLAGLALDAPYQLSLSVLEPFSALVQKLKSTSAFSDPLSLSV